MPRNLYERCEVLFPISDDFARYRLRHEILESYLRDDVKARLLQSDGSYIRAPHTGPKPVLSAQDWLIHLSAHPEKQLLPATPPPTPS
jgi:polyphosphate kinase